VNFATDLLVYLVVLLIVFIIITVIATHGDGSTFKITGIRAVLLTMANYFATNFLMEGLSKGRSLGKVITRTVAVNKDLSRIGWKQAFMRSLCRLIPIEPLSGLGGFPWHDEFTKTIVIRKRTARV